MEFVPRITCTLLRLIVRRNFVAGINVAGQFAGSLCMLEGGIDLYGLIGGLMMMMNGIVF